jgi:hypothetical protein
MKKIICFFLIVILLQSCYMQYPIYSYYTPLHYQKRVNIRTYEHYNRFYQHTPYRYQHFRFIH